MTDLAIVLDGGGARGAYQAGFLRGVARLFPDLRVEVITGVSAGAINAVFLANRVGRFADRAEALAGLWSRLEFEEVIDPRPARLSWRVARWGLRLVSGGRFAKHAPRSFVDTRPLAQLLHRVLDSPDGRLRGIAENLSAGDLKALALTATSYSTSRTVTFVQGRDIVDWERPTRGSLQTEIGVGHVMASSALPLLFPAVRLEEDWFGDGGVRLTAPLAPAIHLGARRILAVSTRYGRSFSDADQPAIDGYPPPAQIAGVLLSAIFLDQLDGDALRVERVNRLLENTPDAARGGLSPVDLAVWRPSRDLGRLANDFEARLPRGLRFLVRGTGTRETRSNDLVSLILFQRDYVGALLELGESDALRQAAAIEEFLAGHG